MMNEYENVLTLHFISVFIDDTLKTLHLTKICKILISLHNNIAYERNLIRKKNGNQQYFTLIYLVYQTPNDHPRSTLYLLIIAPMLF